MDATINTPPLPAIRSWRSRAMFISFSVLYMVNIAMCNESMELVSLPLHQTIRATAPAITAAVSYIFRLDQRPHSYSPYMALIPVVVGAALATYGGREQATPCGLFLTLLGAILAVAKTIVTNLLLRSGLLTSNTSKLKASDDDAGKERVAAETSPQLPSNELIRRVAPFSIAQAMGMAIWTGELAEDRSQHRQELMKFNLLFRLTIGTNGLVACLLNIISFETNRKAGPLSIAVAANVKQVIILIVSTTFNRDQTNRQQITGAMLTVIGGLWYALTLDLESNQQSLGSDLMTKWGLAKTKTRVNVVEEDQ
jgi:drug/metabolite transporter (DMT)-like permease